MILSGDIGGTKTNLAYFEEREDRLVPVLVKSYPSQQYPSLNAILAALQRDHPQQISVAAFGIAGPVVGGRSKLTNVDWTVDGAEVAGQLGLPRVGLINDLVATAYGILRLDPKDILTLQAGEAQERGTIGIIAAGTGLGMGALVWDGHGYRAMPSEGGHSDFAPRNDLEIELLRFLLKKSEHVAVERVAAGPGLIDLYQFVRSRATQPEPAWMTQALKQGDPSATISEVALSGRDPVCAQALDLFVTLYGAEAGNAALEFLATGGLYVAGGIAPKILPRIQHGPFLEAFLEKDMYRPLLERIPVHVVLNDKTALLGAAHFATRMEMLG
jgi:glucokinase